MGRRPRPGKGRQGPLTSDGPTTLKAVDTYLRARARHPEAHRRELWLGGRGKLTGSGIRQMLKRRSRRAGISEVHPHLLRRYFAHTFLAGSGQESDLMRLAAWSSRGDGLPLCRFCGAGLVVQGVMSRVTKDLDYLAEQPGEVNRFIPLLRAQPPTERWSSPQARVTPGRLIPLSIRSRAR